MIVEEFNRFLEDVKKVRTLINEVDAEKVPYLFPELKEGMEIKERDRVRVGEVVYQSHYEFTYTSSYHPDVNPGMWLKLKKRGNEECTDI